MGRLTDLNENSPAIMIPGKSYHPISTRAIWEKSWYMKSIHGSIFFVILGTSHCVDMYQNEPGDPEELVAARARIGELVGKWVNEAK